MARFRGKVGYATTVEISPGVWDETIVERVYSGEVIRNARRLNDNSKVNDDVTVSNSISIVADEYANGHFFAIKYVEWAGYRWKVTDIEVQRPRLLFRLGGVYNGPTS